MKKYFLFVLLILIISVSSCTVNLPSLGDDKDDEIIDENGGSTNPDDDNITDGDGGSDDTGSDNGSTDSGTGDVDNDDVKEAYPISSPDFEIRKITNIDDVTMEDFFNLGNKIDIQVEIKDSELRKLQSDFDTGLKSEIYRLASKVTIKLTNYGTEYKWEYLNVGIRQKGNTSRQSIFSSGNNLNLNHFKLSFDETFDDKNMYDNSFISQYGNQEYKDREFLGMSGLDFKWNKNYDQTHIKEVYANYMYRASGIIVQHSGLSNFSIKNTDKNVTSSMGLCTVFEPATKSLIKRSLKDENEYINMTDWSTEKKGTYGVEGENYGDLYKCSYGANLSLSSISGSGIGISNISGSYVPLYDRKTNKEANYNDTLLRSAVEAISTGNYDRISQYVDLEYLAICEAVGYIVGNPDSMRYNNNNFMIYMRRTDGKMIFIPIDSDRCFGITRDWNPREANMKTEMLDRKNTNNKDTLSLLLNTILSYTSNESQKLYLEFCNKLKESEWSKTETFNKFYNIAKATYSDRNFSLNDSNVSFETYMNAKLKLITPVSDNGSGDNNGGNNNTTKDYNIYIVGTFNDWGQYTAAELPTYKMKKIADNTYSITVTITKGVSTDTKGTYIKFKFNDGYQNYNTVNWKLSEDLKTLLMEASNSQFCYGVKVGDTLTVTINVKTLEASVKIN